MIALEKKLFRSKIKRLKRKLKFFCELAKDA
jgi:hypothetical protein